METISLDMRSGNAPIPLTVKSGTAPISLGFERVRATGDYNDLENKPSINEVELVGNKTFEDLGDSPLKNLDIQAIFNRVFS